MDYKKKYEKAFAHAREIHRNEVEKRRDMEFIFPELAESEDEKIRKMIINHLTQERGSLSNDEAAKAISWLEKQGEDKEINNFDVLPGLYKCVHRMFDGTPDNKLLFEVGNVYKCLSKHDRAEFEISYGHSVYLEDPVVCKYFIPFEKQNEQKSVFEMKTPEESLGIDSDTYNKIVDECVYGEQKSIINGIPTATNYDKMFQNCNVHKFNVGDWIMFNGITLYIEDIVPGYYKTTSVNGISQSYEWDIDKFSRLWTIQDAKDGDMLATKNFVFIFKNIDDDNSVHYYCHYEIRKHEDNNQFGIALPQSLMGRVGNGFTHYSPASKEQCDLLFQTMEEAGYEWDAENKKLKKIENRPLLSDFFNAEYERGKADALKCVGWSEEDEENMKKILDAIGSYYYLTTDDDILCDWLKKKLLSNDKNL